jgi:hypothetical protein
MRRLNLLLVAVAMLTTQSGCLECCMLLYWPWNYSTSVSDTLSRERERQRPQMERAEALGQGSDASLPVK